jgi:hypothetical protein
MEELPIALRRIELEDKLELKRLSIETDNNQLNGKIDIS